MHEPSNKKTRSRHQCSKATPLDVVVTDRNGEDFTLGSIVELIPWGGDEEREYHGLWYVHAFEVDKGKFWVYLGRRAKGRGKFDIRVRRGRLSVRCFRPSIGKGE